MLVCDDEALTALHVGIVLSRVGCQVLDRAASGPEAVAAALRERPDAILMDVHMPGGSGIAAVRHIMELAPTAVVMLTAHGDPETVRQALAAGASGYLVKPFRDDQLLPALTVAIARFQQVRAGQAASQHASQLEDALSREREIARTLAHSFRSTAPDLTELEVGTCYEPASRPDLAGGDFFDFIPLGPERMGVVIGDVCGKGLEAAALTGACRQMLRAYALDEPEPAGVIERLNRAMCHYTTEECSFVTLLYGVLDLGSFAFTYTNAGHPSPLLCEPSHKACRLLEPTGGLLGAVPEWQWKQRTVHVPPGGAIALFTDGVIEARKGPRMLGMRGVHAVVRRMLASNATAMASAIRARALQYGGGHLDDDLAVVVLRRPPAGAPATTLGEAEVSGTGLAEAPTSAPARLIAASALHWAETAGNGSNRAAAREAT